MDDFRILEKSELVDLFSAYMRRYLQLRKEPTSEEEFVNCKKMVLALMEEIDRRNATIPFGNQQEFTDSKGNSTRVA